MAEATRVLHAVADITSEVRFELTELPAGAGEYVRHGKALSARNARRVPRGGCHSAGRDGAAQRALAGWPRGAPQIDLRERLDLYCGLRPIRLFHATDTLLKGVKAGEIDLVILRENTEGLFSARHVPPSPGAGAVEDVLRFRGTGRNGYFVRRFGWRKRPATRHAGR